MATEMAELYWLSLTRDVPFGHYEPDPLVAAAVSQPRKVERSGLWRAVGDRLLIYIHKECELEYLERLYPANHYVLVDDKLRILAAVKDLGRAGYHGVSQAGPLCI